MDSNVDMGSCSSDQHHAAPRLCAAGCGFFGTAENRGLCSKCYKDRPKETTAKIEAAVPSDDFKIDDVVLKEEKKAAAAAATSLTNSATDAINPSAKSRCGLCRRKLGLLGFVCRCGGGFCNMHRHPEAHACSFDFKEAGRMVIEKQNPLCKGDKMTRRI